MRRFLISTALFLPLTCIAANGIYFTADTGVARQTGLPSIEEAQATSMQQYWLPPALRFSAGYNHDINNRIGIGLEAGLGWYAKATYFYANGTTTHIRAETSEYLLTGMLHLNEKHDLFLKLGGIRLSPIVTGTNAPHQETKISFESVLGTIYNFNRNLGLSLSFVYVPSRYPNSIQDFKCDTQGLNELLLGVRYTFAS